MDCGGLFGICCFAFVFVFYNAYVLLCCLACFVFGLGFECLFVFSCLLVWLPELCLRCD